MKTPGKNARVVVGLLVCIVAMVGLAYASVPLYRKFCAATGFLGTTQRVSEAPAAPVIQPVLQSQTRSTSCRPTRRAYDHNYF